MDKLDRHEAYRVVSELLEQLRALPFAQLEARVGSTTQSRVQTACGVEILVDVAVEWHDRDARRIALYASADSPSQYRMERLEERILVAE